MIVDSLLLMPLLTAELPVDKAAHFGISWATNHTAYTICNKITEDKTRAECLIVSSVGTLAVGVAKEILDGNRNSRRQHAMDMAANAAGVALSSLIITIQW